MVKVVVELLPELCMLQQHMEQSCTIKARSSSSVRQVCSGPSSLGAEVLTLEPLLCPFPTQEEQKQEVQCTTPELGWEVWIPSSAHVPQPRQ